MQSKKQKTDSTLAPDTEDGQREGITAWKMGPSLNIQKH